MSQPSVSIGPYVCGEKPVPLQYTFQDSNGVAMDLTGYTAEFEVRESLGVATFFPATVVDPANGVAQHVWTADEYPTPGHYRARMWVGNTTQRFASVLILFDVADAEGPVPAI